MMGDVEKKVSVYIKRLCTKMAVRAYFTYACVPIVVMEGEIFSAFSVGTYRSKILLRMKQSVVVAMRCTPKVSEQISMKRPIKAA